MAAELLPRCYVLAPTWLAWLRHTGHIGHYEKAYDITSGVMIRLREYYITITPRYVMKVTPQPAPLDTGWLLLLTSLATRRLAIAQKNKVIVKATQGDYVKILMRPLRCHTGPVNRHEKSLHTYATARLPSFKYIQYTSLPRHIATVSH